MAEGSEVVWFAEKEAEGTPHCSLHLPKGRTYVVPSLKQQVIGQKEIPSSCAKGILDRIWEKKFSPERVIPKRIITRTSCSGKRLSYYLEGVKVQVMQHYLKAYTYPKVDNVLRLIIKISTY